MSKAITSGQAYTGKGDSPRSLFVAGQASPGAGLAAPPAKAIGPVRCEGVDSIDVCLAANYSSALEHLTAGDPGMVDAVKVSEFDRPEYLLAYRRLGAGKRLLLHGLACPARPGDPTFREVFDPGALLGAIRLTGAECLSVHLEYVASTDAFEPGRFLDALASDVELIREVSGLPVLLENTHCAGAPVRVRRATRRPPAIRI